MRRIWIGGGGFGLLVLAVTADMLDCEQGGGLRAVGRRPTNISLLNDQ